jgi:hypothetical protein
MRRFIIHLKQKEEENRKSVSENTKFVTEERENSGAVNVPIEHGSPNRGPWATCGSPGCIVRPAGTFVNCVYAIKITQ